MDLSIYPVKPLPDENAVELDPRLPDINKGCIICHVGSIKSGKSTVLSNYLLRKELFCDKFDDLYIISPTLMNDETGRFLLDKYEQNYRQEYTDGALRAIVNYYMQFDRKRRPRWGIVLDDCAGMGMFKRESYFNSFVTKFRHTGCKMIYTTAQFYKMLSPQLRANVTDLYISATGNGKEISKMEEELGARFPNFRELLSAATSTPYAFLNLKIHATPAQAYQNLDTLIYTADGAASGDAPESVDSGESENEGEPSTEEENRVGKYAKKKV